MLMQMLILGVILPLALCNSPPPFSPKKCSQLNFLPMPRYISCNLQLHSTRCLHSPCGIRYNINTNDFDQHRHHLAELIEHQQYKTFGCHTFYLNSKLPHTEKDYEVFIQLTNANLRSAFTTKQQSYTLQISETSSKITADHYVGLVRALQTFLQSITCSHHFIAICHISNLPIKIQDQPLFQYRGLLVDTSRHFIPIEDLILTIDAMMYSKMNILHWHIVDQDSFPLELESHPELAQYGAFSPQETYSPDEIKKLIHYAMIRGVRIIPQIDTPGHALSWSKSPQNSGIACPLKTSSYKGALDVTLQKTYKIVKQVFQQIFLLFPDPLVHLGGDQVELTCLANKTQFLRKEHILFDDIQLQYRYKQRKMLKQLNKSKTFIYWMHDNITAIQPQDIMHWWGKTSLLPPNTSDKKIIISWSKGPFYIDMGAGSPRGTQYHEYSTWLDLYSQNIGQLIAQQHKTPNQVIGAQVTLWGQVNNMHTIHTKIWIRSSAFAQRLWTSENHTATPDVLRRLIAHEKLINVRGIPTAPLTSQQCQFKPELC